MNLKPFSTRTFGKWILAGEHTVLRGGRALVFPLRSRFLDFEFQPDGKDLLQLQIPQGYPEEFKLLFWSVFEKACSLKNIKPSSFSGLLQMKANIPVGSGLGASASLCVALARWFESLKLIATSEVFHFAKNLEDVFHGESSGVDVAVVLTEKGLVFERNGNQEVFQAAWQPNWYLSHSGQKGITKECVLKVQSLKEKDPDLFIQLDDQMKFAVDLSLQGLMKNEDQGLIHLIESLNLAEKCFYQWGLVNDGLDKHLRLLRQAGCLALKPTGSGMGGYVLSLWEKSPAKIENIEFLKATVRDL